MLVAGLFKVRPEPKLEDVLRLGVAVAVGLLANEKIPEVDGCEEPNRPVDDVVLVSAGLLNENMPLLVFGCVVPLAAWPKKFGCDVDVLSVDCGLLAENENIGIRF